MGERPEQHDDDLTAGGDSDRIGERVEDAVEHLLGDVSPAEDDEPSGRHERERVVDRDGDDALDDPDTFTA